jgi:ubiquitin carboxyl-terminal hydrolase 9/13
VVVHIGGGPYHGHYVSIIKTQDRGWLLFDDEMVEPVDKRFVTKFFGEGLDAMGHPKNLACAYVLFYQETTVEAMQRELDSEGVPPAAASADAPKDPLAAKTNGVVPNGTIHPHVPSTPLAEDVEQFTSLDHAVTAPAVHSPQLASIPFSNPLEPTPTSPNLPFLKRKKSKGELMAKEEQRRLEKEQQRLEKEEKERKKIEEKELEKQAKLKKKEAEAAKKESYKKLEEDLTAKNKHLNRSQTTPVSSSNTSSKAEEVPAATPVVAPAPDPPSGLGLQFEEPELTLSNNSHPKENGSAPGPLAGSNMLHRFRNTSMSLSRKSHFFSKDRSKEKTRKSEDLPVREPTTPEEQLTESLLGGGVASPELKAEKKKESRFGLGRKKSVNLLSKNHH